MATDLGYDEISVRNQRCPRWAGLLDQVAICAGTRRSRETAPNDRARGPDSGNPTLPFCVLIGYSRDLVMKQVFDQLLKFLHDGIAAIFRFVELIWTWSVDQIARLATVPWQQWPLGKQFLLALILVGVIWALYRAGRELLQAGAAILGAFADLLGVLVRTLPHVMLAGVIALGGVWLVNHLDNSLVRMPTWLQAGEQASSPENRQSSPPSGQQSNPPQDQK